MGIFERLFGGGGLRFPKKLSSGEVCDAAKEALFAKYPEESGSSRLCCIYTSIMDSDDLIDEEGKCSGWHADYYLPESKRVVLARFNNGRIGFSHKAWEDTRKKPVEYVYAVYGNVPELGSLPEPLKLPDKLADSLTFRRNTDDALKPFYSPEHGEEYAPAAVCFPGKYLRYLQDEKTRAILKFPEAPENSAAVICSTDEFHDEDSFLFYINDESGEIISRHAFRYPNLFYFANSIDW